jgi:hypothetical protein
MVLGLTRLLAPLRPLDCSTVLLRPHDGDELEVMYCRVLAAVKAKSKFLPEEGAGLLSGLLSGLSGLSESSEQDMEILKEEENEDWEKDLDCQLQDDDDASSEDDTLQQHHFKPEDELPLLLQDEIHLALNIEAAWGSQHLQLAAAFIVCHIYRHRITHTEVDNSALAMECLRVDGLKAIKKWRAWQAFKSAHRIDTLSAFMYSQSNLGIFTLEIPNEVPEPHVSDGTMKQMMLDMQERLTDDFMEKLQIVEERWAKYLAREVLVVLGEFAKGFRQEEPLVGLGGALCYLREVRLPSCGSTAVPRDLHDVNAWVEGFLGPGEEYSSWREKDLLAREARRACILMCAADRQLTPDLDLLRSEEMLCSACGSHTVLREEHLRSADEASDWFRCCPACGVIKRSV